MGLPSFAQLLREAMAVANVTSKPKKKAAPSGAYVGTSGRAPSSGPSIEDLLRAGQGVGTPLQLGVDYGPGSPTAVAAEPLGANTMAAVQRALAYLGGGPDRSAYLAPFDQAEARAREAHAAALPVIAGQYRELTAGLSQHQGQAQAAAQQAQANQAAAAASQQALLNNLQQPLLRDLQAQGGQAAVGSLAGALQASMAAGQANLGQQALAQQQLSQNLAAGAQHSYDSRIQDAGLAEQAAVGNASANLNNILNQIGLQRAGAERQFVNDAEGFRAQRQQLELQLAQLQDAERAAARQAADPAQVLGQLQATDQLSAYQQQRNAPPAYKLLDGWRQANPVATSLLENVYNQSEDVGEAYSILSEMARSQAKQYGGTYIKYQGKRISVGWIKSKLDELYGTSR